MVIDYYSGDINSREKVVEPLIAGIRQFGVSLFDECSEIMEEGDNKLLRDTDYYAMSAALKKRKYVVLVVTKAMLGDVSILVELDIISKLVTAGKIKVFTVLYQIDVDELPDRVKWLRDTTVIKVEDVVDTSWASLVIAEQYWYDRAVGAVGENVSLVHLNWDNPDIMDYLKDSYVGQDTFVKELLDVYSRVHKHNYSKFMVILILLNRYLCVKYPVLRLSKDNQQCIQRIAESVYGVRAIGKREMNILVCCVVDMLERVG
ncbi:MAG: hypothetical protein IJB96_07630 [Lachnospira sp.]|nr:hypothetical protein [Lachnospira sp.]